jgi:hypothetical protein
MSGLLKNIDSFQSEYYEKNNKNSLFKRNQKLELAKAISDNFSLDVLINNTCYTINGTNKVIIDYNILKLYANIDNYETIITYIFNKFNQTIDNYGDFEVHMNLNSFTITAAERHKKMVELFCNLCLKQNEKSFSNSCQKFIVYYCTTSINQIGSLFMCFVDPAIKDKISLIKKEDSDVLWNSLSMS